MYTSPPKQSGNVALMTAMLTMLFSLTSVLSLDVGRVYFERESLKKLSETVALDVVANSNIFNGESVGDVSTLALESVVRNGFDPDAEGFTISARRIAIETDDNGAWHIPEDSNSAADHVLVEISKEIPSSLFFDLQQVLDSDEEVSDTLTVSVSSVARRSVYAAFSTESRLLAVDSSSSPLLQSILSEMLGVDTVDLALISSSGLLSQQIQINALIDAFVSLGAAAEIDSVSSLLALEVTALQLFEAIQDAKQDAMMVGQRQALAAMIDKASPNIAGKTFALGDILLLETAEIPLAYIEAIPLRLDALIESAVLSVNDVISIPAHISGGLGTLAGDVNIINPPAIGFGPPGCTHIGLPCEQWRTAATSSQIELSLVTNTTLLGLVNADLEIDISGVQGQASLMSVSRPNQGQYSEANFLVDTSLLQTNTNVDVTLLPAFDGLLDLSVTNQLSSDTLSKGNDVPVTLSWPNGESETTVHAGVPGSVINSVLSGVSNTTVVLESELGLLQPIVFLLNGLLDFTILSVSGLEGQLDGALSVLGNELTSTLNPTLQAFGISTNDITIQLHGMSASPAEVVL